MFFVIVGVLIIALNLAGIGPIGAWTWDISGDLWKFCAPFGLATLWWFWTDKSGLDKRREMAKMEARKENRRRENLANLGLDLRTSGKEKRKATSVQASREREIQRVEGKRDKVRQKNRDSIRSGFDSQSSDDGAGARDDVKR